MATRKSPRGSCTREFIGLWERFGVTIADAKNGS